MIDRRLKSQLLKSLAKKSVLLLGPRQTGKSTLIRECGPKLSFNLADEATFLQFVRDPSYLSTVLRAERAAKNGFIFIDEVQRVPSLLNTAQNLIDNEGYRFAFTGSSARKLKRGRANLLPGRIHAYNLGPIVASECDYDLDLGFALRFGTLPEITREKDPRAAKQLLKSYAQIYLNEEIKAEALTKNIESFTRFLFSLAASSARFLDLSKISSLAAVPRQTTQRYFEILEDTLIVSRCEAYAISEKKRLVQHPKFYFFDNGVLNGLLGNFEASEDRRGFLFENFFFNQLRVSLDAAQIDARLSSYRTSAGAEIDLILEHDGEIIAIECKTGFLRKQDLRGFESFQDFVGKKKFRKVVVTDHDTRRVLDGDIQVYPWQAFLKEWV